MTNQIYKVECHVCTWQQHVFSMSEAKHYQRKHAHIDTSVSRIG